VTLPVARCTYFSHHACVRALSDVLQRATFRTMWCVSRDVLESSFVLSLKSVSIISKSVSFTFLLRAKAA
jgi:hypothetical protein